MHFGTKSYLKSTRNHTAKHALKDEGWCVDKSLFNFLTGENVYGLIFFYWD
jgi:hypothetical protein